jgi:GT2 family glycosyltransferase
MTKVVQSVSVVIACYTEKRWNDLCVAIRSALAQEPSPQTVIVSVDGNPALYERLRRWSSQIQVVLNTTRPGASATRNTGASLAKTEIVAFLDDDASARAGWLANLIEPFEEPDVVGTGGFVAPLWRASRPRWFPDEFAWVVGASFRGLPTARSPVRNVWSENMAVRRSVFETVGGFRVDFSKVGSVSRPEDTDLCLRMGKATSGATWIHVPEAIVDHCVDRERARLSFFVRQCYSEGRGKVELGRNNDGWVDLASERSYLRQTVPRGLVQHTRSGVQERDLSQISQTAAMVVGVASAGCGALVAGLRGWWSHGRPA